jgi:molybdopterin converting factor small subunit
MAFAAVGMAIPLGVESLAKATFSTNLSTSQTMSGTASTTEEVQFLTVKVHYFQMDQYVGVSEEYFSILSPAIMRDLLNAVLVRHPAMTPQMMNTMLILLNGTPAKISSSLGDEDKIDLIPLVAGG